jgi:hypothetical protein
MWCPRCKSERIQKDYDNAVFFLRMFGVQKLLCNSCGLVFKAFDPIGTHQRAPSEKQRRGNNRRRGPRFYAHLPAAISLIEGDAQPGKAAYSQPSRGHCETIGKFGMRLSLAGTRFSEAELSKVGRLLFVRIDVPEGAVEAVVSIVRADRTGEDVKKKWLIGVKIQQIADADRERLDNYLAKRTKEAPVVLSD